MCIDQWQLAFILFIYFSTDTDNTSNTNKNNKMPAKDRKAPEGTLTLHFIPPHWKRLLSSHDKHMFNKWREDQSNHKQKTIILHPPASPKQSSKLFGFKMFLCKCTDATDLIGMDHHLYMV